MKSSNYDKACLKLYTDFFNSKNDELLKKAAAHSRNNEVTDGNKDKIEILSQKYAIRESIIAAMRQFPDVPVADVWNAIFKAHMFRKSGIDDTVLIDKVVSADQSWKKSSGHAFEEMIKELGDLCLSGTNISIILQRDLSTLLKAGELANEPRDISWLKEQTAKNIFDLYAIVHEGEKTFCFGCIQAKTSIRDRVTRDREPSIHAMQSFFWSCVFVLDGGFLALPKFKFMVNGGDTEFPENGWHGMYVFSEVEAADRIYRTDLDLRTFKEHIVKAAKEWRSQRQWMTGSWRAEE